MEYTSITIKKRIALFKRLYGGQKYQILFLTILGFINGIVASIGAGALIPLFSFVVHAGNPSEDRVSRYIISAFHYFNFEPNALRLLILVCALFVLKAILTIIFGYISLKISLDYSIMLQQNLYRGVLHTNWSYLSQQKIGFIENTLMVDTSYAKNMIKRMSTIIYQCTSFLMYFIVAFTISRFITLATMGMGLFILLMLIPLMRKTKIYSQATLGLRKEIAHRVNENVVGVKTIKVTGVEDQVNQSVIKFFEKMKKMMMRSYVVRNMPEDALETISLLFVSVVFGLSYTRPGFDFAAFLVVVYLIQKIFAYVTQTHGIIHDINDATPYLERVLNLSEEISRFQEKEEGHKPFRFSHALELHDVKFAYGEADSVINGISFTLQKGEMIGIIGPSGAGKTTIVDILLRLFTPDQGVILVDGTDIRMIDLQEWRKHIGYVSQDIFLRNDTIRSNIAFYNDAVTEKDIIAAAKTAYCYDFIMNLPDKFNTMVGERGLRLSGGERQRIVLARVLAQKPSILILDEATSALDNESEMAIRSAIKNIRGELTLIVIAHRLSTVTDADTLLVLENGSIIERGKPKDLLEDETSYFHRAYTTGLL